MKNSLINNNILQLDIILTPIFVKLFFSNKNMKRILVLVIPIITNSFIFAQENIKKCLTNFIVQNELENNEEYLKTRENIIDYQRNNKDNVYTKQEEITIPVVIHIIHRTQDVIGVNANISNAQI